MEISIINEIILQRQFGRLRLWRAMQDAVGREYAEISTERLVWQLENCYLQRIVCQRNG
jgi:hypothetical protein